jgi:hypothetical protein
MNFIKKEQMNFTKKELYVGLAAARRNWHQPMGCFVTHWVTGFTAGTLLRVVRLVAARRNWYQVLR